MNYQLRGGGRWACGALKLVHKNDFGNPFDELLGSICILRAYGLGKSGGGADKGTRRGRTRREQSRFAGAGLRGTHRTAPVAASRGNAEAQ